MIQGIIFDLGNTLLRFNSTWPDVVEEGAKTTAAWFVRKHIKIDQDLLANTIIEERSLAFQKARETMQEAHMTAVLERALDRVEAGERAKVRINDALRSFFGPEESAHSPFPDAIQTLKTLRRQEFKVGILSNAPSDTLVQRMVNDNGFRPWASPVFSSAGLGWRKPLPEPFELIAQRWRLKPAEIVVVGDTLSADILGAKNAGMHSILATMSENETNEQHRYIRPDQTVDCLAQVPLVIANWNSK